MWGGIEGAGRREEEEKVVLFSCTLLWANPIYTYCGSDQLGRTGLRWEEARFFLLEKGNFPASFSYWNLPVGDFLFNPLANLPEGGATVERTGSCGEAFPRYTEEKEEEQEEEKEE